METLTLEDFFKQNNIDHVDILKIDAESAEYEIFKDTFKNIADKIDCIIGEDHIGGALEPILKGYGFNYTNLSDGRVNANIFIAKR